MTSPTTGPIVSWLAGGELERVCGWGGLHLLSQARPCVTHVLGAAAVAVAGHVLCVSFLFQKVVDSCKMLNNACHAQRGGSDPL